MVPSKRNVCLQLDVLSFSLPSHPKHVSILHSSHIHHIFIHTSFFITQPRVETVQCCTCTILYCTVLWTMGSVPLWPFVLSSLSSSSFTPLILGSVLYLTHLCCMSIHPPYVTHLFVTFYGPWICAKKKHLFKLPPLSLVGKFRLGCFG